MNRDPDGSNPDATELTRHARPTRRTRDESLLGLRCGDFQVDEAIAAGGFSTVYRGHHCATGETVALKILHADLCANPRILTRFVRESRTMLDMVHPAIVRVFDAGVLESDRPYLVMDYLPGGTLEHFIRRVGRLTVEECEAVLKPLSAALDHIHRAGIVHRDLKPSNIGLMSADDLSGVQLLDFGVAKLLAVNTQGPALTAIGQRIGTPVAMSPEQVRGAEVDHRSDIYALGVLLFRMVTGFFPTRETSWEALERFHLSGEPPPAHTLAPVSPRVSAVIARCLAKQADARYQSAGEVLAALREASTDPLQISVGGPVQHAIALLVHAKECVDTVIDVPDEAYGAMDEVLCLVESWVRREGLLVATSAGDCVVAVSPLDGPHAMSAAGVLAQAVQVRDRIAARDTIPGVSFHVAVAPATVHVDTDAEEVSVTSGLEVLLSLEHTEALSATVARSIVEELPVPPGFRTTDVERSGT